MPKNERIHKTFNWSEFKNKKFLSKANYNALGYISEEMLADITPYVPKRTGTLRENGTVEELTKEGFKISWHRGLMMPDGYWNPSVAEFVYEGINPVTGSPIKKWTTAGTTDHWVEVARENLMDEWQEEYTIKFVDSFVKHK